MKRVTSGVLAVLLIFTCFFSGAMTVFAENEEATQESVQEATTQTTEATTGDPTEGTTPPASGEDTTPPEMDDKENEGSQGDGENKEDDENKEDPVPENTYKGPTISADGMTILKLEEGFSKKPYWDYTQWTVGYGTCCPADKLDEYKENGITEEAAEILLHNHLIGVYEDLVDFAEKYSLTFTQSQFDALVLFSYNCGTGWTFDASGTLPTALRNGATGSELIRSFCVWCNAGGSIQSYLIRRRLSESYMFLEGKYLQKPPANYTYVLYDANGGTVKPKIQGFNTNEPANIFQNPTYSGYTFDGWYTQKVGGTKVTKVDSSVSGKTLYAHWKDAQGNDVVVTEKNVNATVTSNGVNVRKGPGTNYTTVGTKNKGDKLLITETASGSGLRWGKFAENQWICLTYTDYDQASDNGGTTTPTTPPADTTPEPTTPSTTPTTAPTTTPTTKPTTTPESTAKVYGVVKANGGLNVRKGASTGHPVVGHLNNGARVEILEQKTVGSTKWGRVAEGWISMTYVTLATDSGTTGTPGGSNTSGQSWTGTIVNCSEFLRIRSGAGTNHAIAGYLAPGDKVTITEKKSDGNTMWGKIDRGWISLDYVKLDSASSGNTDSGNQDSSATAPQGQTGTITTNDLRIRKSAGTAGAVVGYLNKGNRVTITQTTTVSGTKWGKVEKGWISMDYVKLDSADSGSTDSGDNDSTDSSDTTTYTGTVVNCSEFLRIRSGAGTEFTHIGYVYPGDRLTITEFKMNGSVKWARIDKGWVSMDYIRLESDSADSGNSGETKTVTANCLCIRRTAGTSGTVVGYLYYGSKVTILETTTVNGFSWGRTSQGWISLDYVK